MYKSWITLILSLGLCLQSYAQFAPDTLVCGDTLFASYDPSQGGQPTDSLFVWLGNCLSTVRFDFTTASVPDAADMYFVDINGNRSPAGSMPYFGSNCTGPNHFTQPNTYPIMTAMDPQYCVQGFAEIYGKGIPYQDSIRQRVGLPADFKLSGVWQESARLHLDIPGNVIGILFVIKFNPYETTILQALWDCTPSCCIKAQGNSVCAGDSLKLSTEREAFSYRWTGPNGFTSTERSPVIPQLTKADEGWYVVEGRFLFNCSGLDSVYIKVDEASISLSPDTANICLGSSTLLTASGGISYQWDQNTPGIISIQGNMAAVSPISKQTYSILGTDAEGCTGTATATVIPTSLEFTFDDRAPTCPGQNDGSVTVTLDGGQAPFEVRLTGGNWQASPQLAGLTAGTYSIEVRDAAGCTGSQSVTLDDPEPVLATVGTVGPTCTGSCDGAIEIIPLAGKSPFTYFVNHVETDSAVAGFCPGSYEVLVHDANQCSWSSSFEIADAPPFEIDLGRDKKVREGSSVFLEIQSDREVDSVLWEGLCDFNCGPTLEFTPDSSLTVHVTAWSASGCEASSWINISVKKKARCNEGVFAPTAFTPNGDGINERFTIYADPENSDVVQISQLVIMNQWGKVVFQRSSLQPNNPDAGWDGYAKGVPVPEGAYTWAATFEREDGLEFSCGGSVIVMR